MSITAIPTVPAVSRPVYVDRLPPCNSSCPAGENVQAWLGEAQGGRYRAAWEILVRDNPFPAVHGRVCYHPCEDACNRDRFDASVSIHAVERFLGDLALKEGWRVAAPASSGKRVLVVGAGPGGLSAAWHLALRGHTVVIYEAGPIAGGMMHFGIPRYRLPRPVLDAEIARVAALGVEIVVNRPVDDVLAEQAAGGFDAVFLAVGAHLGKRLDIAAAAPCRVYDALEFLRAVEAGTPPDLGHTVAVYGGGNTAMDAARTARRLGADAVVVYRRTRTQMPAHAFEADEAAEEGVRFEWLRTIARIDGSVLTLEVMALDSKDAPQATGRFETLHVDSVILALGQDADTEFLRRLPGAEVRADGTITVGGDMQTGSPGIFAGGDMVPFKRTVTTAVGHGKKAARHIDAWLNGATYLRPPRHQPVNAAMLRFWYGATTPPRGQPRLEPAVRCASFDEVLGGLDEMQARVEAQRCLSCGNCFECDGCCSACREAAIVKRGPGRGYTVDLEKCTGCGICVDQCPCGAMAMVERPARTAPHGGVSAGFYHGRW
jgi:formate dehydrogenase (NADP+) beta subunit